ncbi:conserved hypothetical protein [Ricinus communis]|uniref:Transmembrane protein n=1 Tax=Ricinus communis TaxID=3988 RepID=B9SSK8_RICCO|nr:conserved hypothetical protein [Ricinus communis]
MATTEIALGRNEDKRCSALVAATMSDFDGVCCWELKLLKMSVVNGLLFLSGSISWLNLAELIVVVARYGGTVTGAAVVLLQVRWWCFKEMVLL